MFVLENDKLSVHVLDPCKDRSRLGARYCAGGYIFQVEDQTRGPLVSGPTYPDSFNVFDGQGIPDAFNLSPLQRSPGDSEALIVGVGTCHLDSDYTNNRVVTFSDWHVSRESSSMVFKTEHTFDPFRIALCRSVTLKSRTVRSSTVLSNKSLGNIDMHWFPHPFYPLPLGNELIKINAPIVSFDSKRYGLLENGFITRENNQDGNFYVLNHAAHVPLKVEQHHPVLGLIGAEASYVPTTIAIWGNENTFSWEPFLERSIASGESYSWWIDYKF